MTPDEGPTDVVVTKLDLLRGDLRVQIIDLGPGRSSVASA